MISPLNILIAYPYFKKPMMDYLRDQPRNTYRLVIDSGAFTAWNTGKKIYLDEYCKFLDSIERLRPFHAVQLDVFGDPERTWENFLIMKRRGYDVMPVFTRGDTLERLEEMYAHTDYIMFGGITIGGKNLNYVKWFMEQNKGRPVHWLGFCNMDFVKHYKPFSIDSSSWSSGGRFGNVHFYRGYGQTSSFSRKTLLTMPSDKAFEFAKKSGITKSELALLKDAECWVDSPRNANPSLTKPERTTAKFLGTMATVHRGIDVEKNIGTRFFLACATEQQVRLVFNARKLLIERGIISGLDTSKQRTGTQVVRVRRNELSDKVRT